MSHFPLKIASMNKKDFKQYCIYKDKYWTKSIKVSSDKTNQGTDLLLKLFLALSCNFENGCINALLHMAIKSNLF